MLRAIFILNALLVIASFVFYFVFNSRAQAGADTLGIDPIFILYNSLFYLGTFVLMIVGIQSGNPWLMRITFLIDLAVSVLIVIAPIGIGVAVISLILSFLKPVNNFFENKRLALNF